MLKVMLANVSMLVMVGGAALAGPLEDGGVAFSAGDNAGALGIWLPLAEGGDAAAQRNVGIMHDEGLGVEQNREEAAKWYRMAAEQGDAGAAFNLGLMYQAGEGVAQDNDAAVEWYRKAGENGDVLAQFKLGELYEAGEIVEKDDAEAFKWYALAAEQAHGASQFKMGSMYATGRGVERNLGKATEWNEKADVTIMSGVGTASCTQRSVVMLEKCRRTLPRF